MSYNIKCGGCSKKIADDGFILRHETCKSLLKTEYDMPFTEADNSIEYSFPSKAHGASEKIFFWKYRNWLPVDGRNGYIQTTCEPVIFQNKELNEELKLNNLWLAFNGFWPEKGAYYPTGTIKDLEAITVMQRALDHGYKPLSVASDGNTGRAMAYISATTGLESLIVVPEDAQRRLWLPGKKTDYEHLDAIKLIVLKNADYFDAIETAENITKKVDFIEPEGGSKNIGRRDGMGKVMLAASHAIGRVPDHYFQAVGSGPGVIAAYDEGLKIEPNNLQLHISQNDTFCPIYKAWKRRDKEVTVNHLPKNWEELLGKHYANELTNRNPTYGIEGGLYDCLEKSNGEVYKVSVSEAKMARDLISRTLGIDLADPPAIMFGSLIQAVKEKKVGKDDVILANITGGGYNALRKNDFRLEASLYIDCKKENAVTAIQKNISILFREVR